MGDTTSGCLDRAAIDHFRTTGWLLTDTLGADGVARLGAWVDDIAAWPVDGDGWLQHFEMTDHGPVLCRSENLIPFHEGLRALLTDGAMIGIASMLMGEQAVLYKEKINYKLPGGAGYAPHQDAPAYPFIDSHISCMVAIDDATTGNGCLEVVSGAHRELLEMNDAGCINAAWVAAAEWIPVEVPAGRTLWFHSLTPHRSAANRSDRPRRALYPTYNALREGDLRDEYYAHKLEQFADPDDRATVRVSLIGDFQGRQVR